MAKLGSGSVNGTSALLAVSEPWAGNGTVYLGGPDVTSSNGMLTEKGAVPFQFILPAGESLYAITGMDTEDLRVLRPSAS